MRNREKKQRLLLAAQIVLTVVLTLVVCFLYLNGDRKGPEISFSDNERILSGDMTEEELTQGVHANDSVDGDVSQTLRVESATKVAGDRVLLVYAAKDKSNNVASATRTVVTDETFAYKGMIVIGSGETKTDSDASKGQDGSSDMSSVPAESESSSKAESLPEDSESVKTEEKSTVSDEESLRPESETASTEDSSAADSSAVDSSAPESRDESTESADSSLPAESTESIPESSPAEYEYDSEMSTEDAYSLDQFVDARKKPSSFTEEQIADLNESLRNANNTSISRLPDGYPVIRLNTYAVRKGASDSFTALRFISDLRDDADPATDIFGRISVTGNGELNKPGIHTVNYYVTDSEGNRSNVAHLVVIVTE